MKTSRYLPLWLCAVLTTACQRYAPEPLDLASHHQSVEARDPYAADVLAYAQSLSAPATAEPGGFDVADGLSLPEAEVVALFYNPQLRVARLRAEVPRVGAAHAGRWADPELAVDGERIIESVAEPWVLAGTLNLTVPLSGRLGVDRQRLLAEAGAAALRAWAEERRVVADLGAEWAAWSAVLERVALTRQVLAELDALAARATRLREIGEVGPLEERLLRLERANQAAKLQGYEAEAREAALGINARLGLAPAAPVKLLPSITIPPDGSTAESEIAPRLMAHPRVRAPRAEYEAAERALELAVREQYPDLRVGGGFGIDEGDERIPFGLALPLPLFGASRRAIAEARAARELARASAEAEYEQLLAESAVARVRMDAARERLALVEREIAPLADRQLSDARRLAEIGEFDALVLLESVRTAHEARLEVLAARLNVSLAARRLNALLESEPDAWPPSPEGGSK